METHVLVFVQDLAVIMVLAGIITVLFRRLKQPVVLGYILAGILIGPHTPPFAFLYDIQTIRILAGLGVIFLMFSLGLEFDIGKLRKVGAPALVAAFLEIVLMMAAGYQLGIWFKWSPTDALFLGAIIAISSTTIILKALKELKLTHKKFAHTIFGILIIEDVFAIAILALLSSFVTRGIFDLHQTTVTTVKLALFLLLSLISGVLLIPRIINYIAAFASKEMMLITVLGMCFGFCLLVIKLHYSMALGAFIIGAVIAESQQLKTIEQLIAPLRNMFSAIFFVSVGLLFDPKILQEHLLAVIIVTIIVIVGKVITCSFGTFITGENLKNSVRVGMGLAQIGEFSFIIASLGSTLKATSAFLFPLSIAVSVITTFLTPYLIRLSDPLTEKLALIMPRHVENFLTGYTEWVAAKRYSQEEKKHISDFSPNITQLIFNLIIVIAIFLSGELLVKTPIHQALTAIMNLRTQITIIWSICFIISLPLLITSYHKINNIINGYEILSKYQGIAIGLSFLILLTLLSFVFYLSDEIFPPFEIASVISLGMLIIAYLLNFWFKKIHDYLHGILVKAIKKSGRTF